MDEFRKKWWYLVLGGVIRAALAAAGGWLAGRGLIDDDTRQQLVSEGVADIAGWAIIAAVALWSAANKTKLLSRIRAALGMQRGATLEDAKEVAAQSAPVSNKVPLCLAATLLAAALVTGGATGCRSPYDGVPAAIVDLQRIVTPHEARNALAVLQEARVVVRDSVADAYVNGQISRPKVLIVEKWDHRFTEAWGKAAHLVDVWSRMPGSFDRSEFDRAYAEATGAYQKMAEAGGAR